MVAKLVVAKGKTSVKEVPLNGDETIIGRRSDCTLRIPSPLVSRQHCTLRRNGERLLVKDLGSSNGTFVNGSRVKQKELRSGDTLGVGPITFIVQLGAAAASPSDTARPGAAIVVADESGDVADYVVEAEADAEAVVEAEPVEAEAAEDDADFVVAEDAAGGDEMDFVVAEEATTGGGDLDFVVADEAAEPETLHDATIAEFADNDTTKSAEPDTAILDEPIAAEVAAEEPEPPKKKGGLFGKLFKKKVKPKDPPANAAPPPPAKSATSKKPATPPHATAPAAVPPHDDAADFFVQNDTEKIADAKPVGEEELADFLMGLNEKDS
jgi:pSer/pThr/pTyr-binding forkhead associated (FHA) protein